MTKKLNIEVSYQHKFDLPIEQFQANIANAVKMIPSEFRSTARVGLTTEPEHKFSVYYVAEYL